MILNQSDTKKDLDYLSIVDGGISDGWWFMEDKVWFHGASDHLAIKARHN